LSVAAGYGEVEGMGRAALGGWEGDVSLVSGSVRIGCEMRWMRGLGNGGEPEGNENENGNEVCLCHIDPMAVLDSHEEKVIASWEGERASVFGSVVLKASVALVVVERVNTAFSMNRVRATVSSAAKVRASVV